MPGPYQFGPFCLDPARRTLARQGQPVPLTARAFDVLLALVERRGRTVEKDELLRLVWPDTIVEEANLSQQVFTIRKLLGAGPEETPYIATVPRRGYRFVAEVQETSAAPGAASTGAPPAVRSADVLRLSIPIPGGAPLAAGPAHALALSPDGRSLVYVAAVEGTTQLLLRPLDRFEAAPLAGTEGASCPFFSPDGRWVAFQAGSRLRKVPVEGGPATTIAELEGDLRGASWSARDEIVFAPGPASGLWRVSASGTGAAPLTKLRFEAGERTHRWPHALPGGRGVVFTVSRAGAASFDEACLAIADLDEGGHRVVVEHASDGRFSPTGHLVWTRGAALVAAPFDLDERRVTGAARPVLAGVATTATGAGQFAWSSSGTLVHAAGEAQTQRRWLVRVDRAGQVLARAVAGEALEEPRLSPDGGRVIVGMRRRSSDLWLYDRARDVVTRLTFEAENFAAIWGPGAETVTFSSSRGGAVDIYCLRPDRTSPPEPLIASEFDKVAGSWLRDGSALLFTEYHPETGADIWVYERGADRVRPFVQTRFNEYAPVFSPDGRWVAYTSDESGRAEVHVVSYPAADGKRQLSSQGGAEPQWTPDGRELLYRSGDRLMRVDMSRGPSDAGVPQTVFEGRFVPGTVTGLANYDLAPDGSELLMVAQDEAPAPDGLLVTVGWFGEIERKFVGS